MKIITTLIMSLVLSLGLVVAPATADEWDTAPVVHTTTNVPVPPVVDEPSCVSTTETIVVQAYDDVDRLTRIANRRQVKIIELRAVIRELRRSR
jgi:hypothetical protein